MSEFLKTNVPSVEFSETGITVPTTDDVLKGVLADYNAAFGGNLNTESVSTPQYTLATEQTEAIVSYHSAMAFALSQFDPQKAMGIFQDAIAKIYFLSRKAGTPTIVQALCTGAPGFTLQKGARARDTNGRIYVSIADGTFSSQGQATIPFAAEEVGAFACAAQSLIHIERAVFGWDAITNETAGVTGSDVESRQLFESRRFASVAKNGRSSLASIFGAVSDIEGVSSCYVDENDTDEEKTVGATDTVLVPHSVFVSVVGGTDDKIARAIWEHKTPGTNTNGTTTVTVVDENIPSRPEYSISFLRPTFVPILFTVQIARNSVLPETISADIKTAIVKAFDEFVANKKIGIGTTIFSSRFFGAVTQVNDVVDVVDIMIGTDTATETTVAIGVDEMPTVSENDVTVVIVEQNEE